MISCLSTHSSICPFIYTSICMSISSICCAYVHRSIYSYPSIYLLSNLCIYLFSWLYIYLRVWRSIYTCINLTNHPSSSICLPIYHHHPSSTYLFIYPNLSLYVVYLTLPRYQCLSMELLIRPPKNPIICLRNNPITKSISII